MGVGDMCIHGNRIGSCVLCSNAAEGVPTGKSVIDDVLSLHEQKGPTPVEGGVEEKQFVSVDDALEEKVRTTKIEDGDLVIIQMVDSRAYKYHKELCKSLQRIVTDEMGIAAKVIFVDEGFDISVVKKAELGDLHQRLEDLETKLDGLAFSLGQ